MKLPEHEKLDAFVCESTFTTALGETEAAGETETASSISDLLRLDSAAPFQSSDEIRKAIRDMLRLAGFKPTGRSKPASEYLIKAATQDQLRPINLAVDVCNVVSLHSGLPISVFDADLVGSPLEIRVADPGSHYVFNPSGQSMDIGGLLCVCDPEGPCANAVKDSQRTKTNDQTRRTISVIWGTKDLPGYCRQVAQWYQTLLEPFAAVHEI